MIHDRSLHGIRVLAGRGLLKDYFVERELPDNIKVPLGRLRLLDDQADNEVQRELDDYLGKIQAYLPHWANRAISWVREPHRLLTRILISMLLVLGGVFSFLPVLGFWMLPLGLIIISQEVIFLRRPLVEAFKWCERQWNNLRRRFQNPGER